MQVFEFFGRLNAEAWAAWVQAIGSIVGIFTAIGVGRYQALRSAEVASAAIVHSQQIIEDQEITRMVELFAAPIAMIEAFLAAAEHCHAKMEYSRVALDHQNHQEIVERMRDVLKSFARVEAHRLPSVPAIRLMVEMPRTCKYTVDAAEEYSVQLRLHTARVVHGDLLRQGIASVEAELGSLKREAVRMAQPAAAKLVAVRGDLAFESQ
jgi:hypothetical protein